MAVGFEIFADTSISKNILEIDNALKQLKKTMEGGLPKIKIAIDDKGTITKLNNLLNSLNKSSKEHKVNVYIDLTRFKNDLNKALFIFDSFFSAISNKSSVKLPFNFDLSSSKAEIEKLNGLIGKNLTLSQFPSSGANKGEYIKNLNDEIRAIDERIKKGNEMIAKKREEINKLTAANVKTEGKYNTLNAAGDVTEANLKKLDNFKKKIQENQQQIDKLLKDIVSIDKGLSTLGARKNVINNVLSVEGADNKIKKLKEEITSINVELQKLHSSGKAVTDKGYYTKEASGLINRRKEIENEILLRTNSIKVIEQEAAAKRKLNFDSKSGSESSTSKEISRIDILKGRIDKLNAAYVNLRTSKKEYNEDGSLTATAQRMRAIHEALQRELSLRTQTIAQIEKQEAAAAKAAAKGSASKSAKKTETFSIEQARQEVVLIDEKLKKQQQAIRDKREEINLAKQLIYEAQKSVTALQEKIKPKMGAKELDPIMTEFNKLDKSINDMNKDLVKSEAEIKKLGKSFNGLKADKKRIGKVIDEKENEAAIKKIKEQLKSLDADMIKLANSNKVYNADKTLTKQAQSIIDEKKRLTDELNLRQKGVAAVEKQAQAIAKLEAAKAKEASRGYSNVGLTENEKRLKTLEERLRKVQEAFTKLNVSGNVFDDKGNLTKKAKQAKDLANAIQEQIRKHKQSVFTISQEGQAIDRNVSSTTKYIQKLFAKAQTISQIERALKMAKQARDNIDLSDNKNLVTINAINKALRQQEANLNRLKSVQTFGKGIKDQLKGVGQAVLAAYSLDSLQAFLSQLIKIRGEFELQQVALRAIAKDKFLADQVWDKTVALAVKSPFTVSQLTKYTKQMAAYQIQTNKLYDTTKMLADVSAGLGVDMQRLILAYGQIKAANFLRASEVRQLTEAGVDVYGELAKYFSETRGRIYEVAEVIQMVTKRLVTFGDVEAIFQRLTSASGEFYNMQEIQSTTIKGMVSNLRDSVDLMYNDIGKSAEPVIKLFINAGKSIADNWKVILPILMGMSVHILAKLVPAVVLYFKTMINKIYLTTAAANGAAMAFRSLAGVFGIVIGVVSAIFTYTRAAKTETAEMNERLADLDVLTDKLSNSLHRINAELTEIGKNNDLDIKLGKIDSDENISRIKGELKDIEKLMPSLLIGVDLKENTGEEMVKKISELQEMVDLFHDLGYLLKGEDKDDIESSMNTFSKNFIDINDNLVRSKTHIQQMIREVKDSDLFSEEDKKKWIETSETLMNEVKKFQDEVSDDGFLNTESLLKFHKKLNEIEQTFESINREKTVPNYFGSLNPMKYLLEWDYDKLLFKYEKKFLEYTSNHINFKDKTKSIIDRIAILTNEQLKAGVNPENINKQISETLKNLNIDENALGALSNAVKEQLDKDFSHIEIKYSFKPVPTELSAFGKMFNEELKEIAKNFNGLDFSNFESRVGSDTRKAIEENIKNLYDTYNDLAKKYEKYQKDPEFAKSYIDNDVEKEDLENATRYVSALKEIAKYLGLDLEKEKKGGKSVNDIWSKRLDILKKIKAAYEENIKTFNKDDSLEKVINSYEDSFKEVWAGTGKTIQDIAFTSDEEFKKSLDSIESLAAAAGKSILKTFMIYRSGVANEIDVDEKKNSQKELVEMWNKTLENYKFAEDLRKVGFGGEVLDDLVGEANNINLDKLKKTLEDISKVVEEHGEEFAENYKKMKADFDDIIVKSKIEQMKAFVKVAENSLSALGKIELDKYKEIFEFMSGVQHLTGDNDKKIQKEVIDMINKKFAAMREKQLLDDFKGSDMFVTAMENMEAASVKSLELIKKKLQETITSANDLSHTEIKSLVGDIEKIDDIIMKRNPFRAMIDSYTDLRTKIKDFNTTFSDKFVGDDGGNIGKNRRNRMDIADNYIAYSQDEISKYEEIVSLLELIRLKKIENNEFDVAGMYLNEEILQQLGGVEELNKMSVDGINDSTKGYKNQLDTLKKNQKVALDYKKAVEKADAALLETTNNSVNTINQMADISKEAVSAFESIGKFGDGMGESFGLAIDAFKTLMNMIPQIVMLATSAGSAINMALGIIGLIAMAANAAIQISKAIVSFKDNEIKRKIEGIQKKVDELKESADELREAFDLSTNVKNSMANIKDLQENTARAIERTKRQLEEAKKIAKAKDREAAIEEATSQIEEVAKQTKEDMQMFLDEFGGVGDNAKSWLEDLVDSWYEAAMNGEDALGALTDKFDEFINNIIKKQLLLRGADKIMQPVFEAIDKMLEDGIAEESELQSLQSLIDEKLPVLGDTLEHLSNAMGGLDVSGLSDLQGSIQGMSESTAEVLAGYLNSIRFSVLTNQENVSQIVRFIQGDIFSPVVEAIRTQTLIVGEIRDLVNQVSITSGSGRAFRVVY